MQRSPSNYVTHTHTHWCIILLFNSAWALPGHRCQDSSDKHVCSGARCSVIWKVADSLQDAACFLLQQMGLLDMYLATWTPISKLQLWYDTYNTRLNVIDCCVCLSVWMMIRRCKRLFHSIIPFGGNCSPSIHYSISPHCTCFFHL